MATTRAIVLAAGVGARLRPYTDDRPKCLLEVGGRSLIEHQLESLAMCGICDVTVVVGYEAERIRAVLGARVRYIDNPRYADTNSLYSLWLARDEICPGALILNSDVLALPELFARVASSSESNVVLVERGHGFEPEDMKVELRGDLVVDFGKDLPPERSQAHNVGMVKFSAAGAEGLIECLDELVRTGHENDWAPAAYRVFARRWPLTAIPTNGMPWIEIDFPDDLARARGEVMRAIQTHATVSVAAVLAHA